MGELILILGGVRSGKSTYAQQWADRRGGERVLYVATAEGGDQEMQERIAAHRRERPPGWRTLEAQRAVGRAIREAYGGEAAIVVDCLTVLVSNRLLEFEDPFVPQAEAAVVAEVEALAVCAREIDGPVIVVSNEVGMGVVPPYPLGRAYRDLLGKANQVLAREADQVQLLVAGIPLQIK